MKMTTFKRTFEEILALQNAKPHRKRPSDEEHNIQCACVRWFNYQYPQLRLSLFSVPNGGRRDKVTAAKLKAEGVVAGVADLLLLKPNKQYHALCIEMKRRTGRQALSQREWQKQVEQDGYKYIICRSFEDFKREINEYLSTTI